MRCPICKREVDPATVSQEGSFFPFCSERCKLIDLGRWLDGSYQIPAEITDEDAAGPDTDSPPGSDQP